MLFLSRCLLFFLCLTLNLFAEKIETFYGPLDVEEPVLLELIHCPAMQRLKEIHQYGIAYYTTHREEYNRFDHSLGVFAILRFYGASLEEQISGLLHDVSHTVFSHVGDWVFNKEYQENDYQTTIQRLYLATSGVEKILHKYGFTIEQVLPKKNNFIMLEQSLPNLCADRIDYNIQGAYFQNFLTLEETREFLKDLRFVEGRWLMTRADLATKLVLFSLFMTEDCWGSPVNYVLSRWFADAILQGLRTGILSWDEFHFGIDNAIWEKLCASKDGLIQNRMHKILHPDEYYHFVALEEADVVVRSRFRGIDPWILQDGAIVRLTELQDDLVQAFEQAKKRAAQGWPVKFRE